MFRQVIFLSLRMHRFFVLLNFAALSNGNTPQQLQTNPPTTSALFCEFGIVENIW